MQTQWGERFVGDAPTCAYQSGWSLRNFLRGTYFVQTVWLMQGRATRPNILASRDFSSGHRRSFSMWSGWWRWSSVQLSRQVMAGASAKSKSPGSERWHARHVVEVVGAEDDAEMLEQLVDGVHGALRAVAGHDERVRY